MGWVWKGKERESTFGEEGGSAVGKSFFAVICDCASCEEDHEGGEVGELHFEVLLIGNEVMGVLKVQAVKYRSVLM